MLLYLFLGGILETMGAVSLVPLLAGLFGQGVGSSTLLEHISGAFQLLGLAATLENTILVICAAMLLKGLFTFLAYLQVGYVEAEVTTRLRSDLLDNILSVRWPFFVSQPSGALSYALSTEAPQAGVALRYFCLVLSSLAQTLAYTLAGLLISWQVMVVACLCGGFFLLAFRRLIKSVRNAGMRQSETLNSMTSVFTDGLAGAKPLKVMGAEEHFVSFVRTQSERYKQAARQYVMGVGALAAAQEPALAVLLAAGLYWGHSLLAVDGLTLVTLAFFFHRAVSRFSGAQQSYQQFVGVEGILSSLRAKIASLRRQREPGGVGHRVTLKREVRLEGVKFAYEGKIVLEGLDLTISMGSITALHGPSGAGKTTVADLVAGLVAPGAGRVTVDSVPLSELDLRHWRTQIGYVPQEVFLFNDTIRNNVALGRDIPDERIWEALDQAGAKSFVETAGCGLDYQTGEHGRALSGGQRQRLMIARALAGSPRLLILDEATTGLDEATEREIWSRIVLLKGSMAVLAVSHQQIVQEVADSVIQIEMDLGPQAKPTGK